MNILYHHRTRGREVEGVHIRGIVHALRDLGHDVRVMSFPGADPERAAPAAAAAGRGGTLARLVTRAPGVLFELLEIGYNAVTWWRVGREIRANTPDLIYERYSLFLFATIWNARRNGIPIVLEINDSALVPRVRPLRLKGLARRIERWCLCNCTGLVFISTHFRDVAESAYGALAPSVVSPNAADAGRFDPARFDRPRLRRERGLGDVVVCGYVGAFVHWHGVAEFVRRIATRLAAAPRLALLLVGGGVDLATIRRTVDEHGLADRIFLPGRVDHASIPEWIACMDYAVLPNSNEYGSPMKLFEFMAMGIGVVAPDYGPIAEVIEDGRTGWLFARGDVDSCVDRVLALAERDDERAAVGRAARAYIVRERQWRNNAEQLLSLVPSSEAGGA
ncbi:MAG TPA: glycosyltransferase [Rhodanobacteraceae bacterium]|jgi:glycosyltransferase involved in cell wall biosynthesis|nr:glycosyltransferase [Rhodanobacteraceae bacterium]